MVICLGLSEPHEKGNVHMRKNVMKYWVWMIGLVTIFLYKFCIIKDYASLYTDDDQALMWYGTSLAAHFKLAEPHFLGQAYGSMIESIIAVPFYWLGIQLNVCLPLATFLLWIAPFALLSFVCLKRDRPVSACVCLLVPLLSNWDYDILTTVPRSFIGGFIFAFIGILLLESKSKIAKLVSFVLLSVAYIATETTIAVIALGLLHYIMWRAKKIREESLYLINGELLGAFLIWFCNEYFYEINPEYNLHGSGYFSVSLGVFQENLKRLGKLLSSFSLGSTGNLPILLITVVLSVLVLVIKKKCWRDLFLVVCAVGGSMSFLSVPKTLDYHESLLFAQSRMFLFIPYVIVLVFFYLSYLEDNTWWKGNNRKTNNMVCILLFILVGIGIGKTIYFKTVVLNNEMLYYDPIVGVKDTTDIYNMAREIQEKVDETGVDTVIFLTDNRGCGYATSAINYDNYLGYNAYYDRRTPTYLLLKNTVYTGNVLFVETDGTDITNMYTEYLEGVTPIDWLMGKHQMQRYPETHQFYLDRFDSHIYEKVFCPSKNMFSVSEGLLDWKQGDFAWSEQLFETTIINETVPNDGLHLEIYTPISYYTRQNPDIVPFVHVYVNGQYIRDIELVDGESTCDLYVEQVENHMYKVVLITNCYFIPSQIESGEDGRALSLGIKYIGN